MSCLRFLFYTRYFSLFSKSHIPIQIANWDVSRVTHFNGLFKESQFNEPLCNWDTGMSSYEQTVLTPSNYTLRHIYPGSVTSMHSMFFDNRVFNQPLSHFNTTNVRDVRFYAVTQCVHNLILTTIQSTSLSDDGYVPMGNGLQSTTRLGYC